jgi:hypothetical protein
MEQLPEKQQDEAGGGKESLKNYAKFSGAAFQMIAIIGLFTFAGYKIDERRGADTPLVTAFASLAGVLLALYFFIRSLRK